MSRGFFPRALAAAVLVTCAQPVLAAGSGNGNGGGGGVAVETAAATLAPNQFVWNDTDTGEPVRLVINIGEQRAYVYRGEALVAATAVSTGRVGKETPSGTFTILQKNIDHRSNLYSNAPMPFMQRLTWDGIAIHAGVNPGRPASHGCIRVPMAFAKKLFGITQLGTEVTVIGADGEIAPTVPQELPGVDREESETAAANRAAMKRIASR
jgi:lipoprotein-anchoring transpeptidase ErfK/SrfK